MIQKKVLGKTGVEVTEIGFGCAPIGDLFTAVSAEKVNKTLETAWSTGIRYFDTAPYYGHGKSEHRLGEFLRSKNKDQFIVSTKVGRVLEPTGRSPTPESDIWINPSPYRIKFDYTYDGIMRSYEDSLQRLALGYVDLLLIHDLDTQYHQTEERVTALMYEMASSGWRAIEELKSCGAIKGIGAGINYSGLIPRFLDLMDLDFFLVAGDYNLLDQNVLDEEFPRCNETGVKIVVGALFASGILATGVNPNATYRYEPPPLEIINKVIKIEKLCKDYNINLATAALQFPLAHPLVIAEIPGANDPHFVTENAKKLAIPIPSEFWSQLKKENLLREDAPIPS